MEPDTKPEVNKERIKAIFKKLLDENGWVRDRDSEDRCGLCWDKYLEYLREKFNAEVSQGKIGIYFAHDTDKPRGDNLIPISRAPTKEDTEEIIKEFISDSQPLSLFVDKAPDSVSVRDGWYSGRCHGPGDKDQDGTERKCPDGANIFVSADGKTIEVNEK